jgi:hypothetical protein
MVSPKVTKKRFEQLKSLSPSEAVNAWLDGDFGFGDEPTLVAAILKDFRIRLSPEKIEKFMSDTMDSEEADVQAILDRLADM